MNNPLYNVLGGQNQTFNDGGLSQFIADVKRMQQTFQGDPRAEVQRLLNSGQMTQQQFNQLSQLANQYIGLIR